MKAKMQSAVVLEHITKPYFFMNGRRRDEDSIEGLWVQTVSDNKKYLVCHHFYGLKNEVIPPVGSLVNIQPTGRTALHPVENRARLYQSAYLVQL